MSYSEELKVFAATLMLFYMKHCNYEKLKPILIKAGMGHIRNESEEQAAYARDMFETIFKNYKKEKYVHISGLLAEDLINLMHNPEVKYVTGGHLSTILKADDYIQVIREFLQKNIR